jgi:hypothetical protein
MKARLRGLLALAAALAARECRGGGGGLGLGGLVIAVFP